MKNAQKTISEGTISWVGDILIDIHVAFSYGPMLRFSYEFAQYNNIKFYIKGTHFLSSSQLLIIPS